MIGEATTNRVGVARNSDGHVVICYQGDASVLRFIRNAPGATAWPDYNCVAFPLTREGFLLVETVGRVEEATQEYIRYRNRAMAVPSFPDHPYPEPIYGRPSPFKHQIDGHNAAVVSFRKRLQGFGLFSEQGVGKSRNTIDILRSHGARTVLVLAQNSTIYQWESYLKADWPEAQVVPLAGVALTKRSEIVSDLLRDRNPASSPTVFLLNWEALARMLPTLTRFRYDFVIADEATRIKGRTTQVAKAAHTLALCASHRLALTGTPMGQDPKDLWSLYRYIDPTVFPNRFWRYCERYFLLGGFTGYEFTGFRPEMLGEFLSKMYSCAYRVTKATIQDMPPKTFEIVKVAMEGKQREVYERVEKDLFYTEEATEDGASAIRLDVPNRLVLATRLLQITSGHLPTDAPDDPTEKSETGRVLPSAKTAWLCDYARENILGQDTHVVVWCRFRQEIDRILAGLREAGFDDTQVARIDGTVKARDREDIRNRFNRREDPLQILVCQIQAAAYGIDLPAADVMLFHSLTYSLTEWLQAVDRGHRAGRSRPYLVLVLMCKTSIDEKIYRALQQRQDFAQMLMVEARA